MPKVKLSRRECQGDLLPPVCMYCGVFATSRVSRTFCSVSPIILLLLGILCSYVGVLAAIILALSYRVKATVPMCPIHRDRRQVRSKLIGLAILSPVLVVVVCHWMQSTAVPNAPTRPGWLTVLHATFVTIPAVVFLGFAIWQETGVQVESHGPRLVGFRRVHPAFIAALEARRLERGVKDIAEDGFGDQRDDFDDEAMQRRREGKGRFGNPTDEPF